jgi:hypothetical protein
MSREWAAIFVGVGLVAVVLWEAFEAIILPRRVTRRVRLTRFYYRTVWRTWKFLGRLVLLRKRREAFFSYFGPLSLLLLFVLWAVGLVLAFALLHYGTGSAVNAGGVTPSFATDLYLSGTTFFTLGLGDVIPRSRLARILTVAESGMGFGFLAIVIGYLPVIYQSFSRREVNISLLDSRAGSPPSAGELLRRHSFGQGHGALRQLLQDWERWSADLLESHLSYPVLAFFRSQHDNQSWLSALTAILDSCALVMTGLEGDCQRQAELTFAMARHAVVDLAQVFASPPRPMPFDRLLPEDFVRLRETLANQGMRLSGDPGVDARLTALRALYEPYVYSLAEYLRIELPPWIPTGTGRDNWQTSAWGRLAGFVVEREHAGDDHD